MIRILSGLDLLLQGFGLETRIAAAFVCSVSNVSTGGSALGPNALSEGAITTQGSEQKDQ